MQGSAFFQHVADALASFLPPDLRGFHSRRGSRNVKVWFGDADREHYEAQLLSGQALRTAGITVKGPALEIGFHAEHRDAARNEDLITSLTEKSWRKALGDDPVAGAFIGAAPAWRRLSEVWDGPVLLTPEAATEAADRLAAYVLAIEPLRTG